MRYSLAHWALLICVTFSIVAGIACTATAKSAPGVVPPCTLGGELYRELSAKWWQWEFSLPYSRNPWFDNGGDMAYNGQCGPIFFLTGSFTGEPECRYICLPPGKYLFLPVMNAWADNIGVDPPMSFKELQDFVASFIDLISKLYATVDGRNICNLFDYRIKSRPFAYWLPPKDNVFQHEYGVDCKGWVYPAVSDGYWLLLEPLPLGKHKVTFGAWAGKDHKQDITYYIEVKKHCAMR